MQSGRTNHDFIEGSSQMKNVVTVEQLMNAVEFVQTQQREVQQSLEQLLRIFKSLDPRAEIPARELISPGRVGKVCTVIRKPSKLKKAD